MKYKIVTKEGIKEVEGEPMIKLIKQLLEKWTCMHE